MNQVQTAWPLKKPQQLVYVELGPNNGGMMLGVCEIGLSYRAVSPLIVDGPIQFSFAPDGKTRLQGVGEIVWSEDGGKSGGLKFTSVSPQFREALRSWLASESTPRITGREVTPAVAIPLDSMEKIKSHVRATNPEPAKPLVSPRSWDTKPAEAKPVEAKPVETKSLETKPAEKSTPASPPLAQPREPIAATSAPPPVQAKPEELSAPERKPVEATPVASSVAEAKPPEKKFVEPTIAEPKPIEQKPVESRAAEPQPSEPKTTEKTAADFLLPHVQAKAEQQSQRDWTSPLPKFRLPFASAPAAPESIPQETPATPAASVPKVEAAPQTVLNAPEEPKIDVEQTLAPPEAPLPTDEVVAALAAPGLLGLHEPQEFVAAEPLADEEPSDDVESPRLNRAAAAAIIGLALAIILVALVLSFRREAGEALIHFGETLAGEERTPVIPRTSSAPPITEVDDSSYPPVAAPAKRVESSPQPSGGTASSPGGPVKQISDLPVSKDGGTGQKEFEEARNILKGSHRQRDIAQAVSLLWTGVQKGYVPADVTLADLYARGDGVDQSCDQARILLEAAIQRGSPEGRRRLELLKQQGCQ